MGPQRRHHPILFSQRGVPNCKTLRHSTPVEIALQKVLVGVIGGQILNGRPIRSVCFVGGGELQSTLIIKISLRAGSCAASSALG